MTTDDPETLLVDAARRMMDCVNMHVLARLTSGADRPQFVAIKLDDGSSPDNHTLYDTRQDVFRGKNKWHKNIMAVKVGADSMSLREAIIVLQMNRRAYKAGIIFSEEAPLTLHLPELMRPFIPHTLDRLN